MSGLVPPKSPNLGFGNMRMPKLEDGTPDKETIFKMIDTYLAHGYNYFDTAHIYGGSEEMLKLALVDRYPRDRYFITTKLYLGDCECEEDMMKQFETSRERLGLDQLDMYFLHGLDLDTEEKVARFHAFDFLRSLRDRGLTKHIGFSFHGTPDLLEKLLSENPDVELVQLQLNYLDWDDKQVQARRCYETARAHGVMISVMEPCKGGLLAGGDMTAAQILLEAQPETSVASWAFRFVAGHEGIYAILSGMCSPEQVEDNCNTFDHYQPLTEDEMAVIHKVVETLNDVPGVPCTNCQYCMGGCPQGLNIPYFMKEYNAMVRFRNLPVTRHSYKMMCLSQKPASECIECLSCEGRCPQHIQITKVLKEVVAQLQVDGEDEE